MTYDPSQDDKLTAYALGELESAEVNAVEKTLAAHPEARAYVEDVRRTAGRLSRELRAEPAVSLTPTQSRRLTIAPPRHPMFVRATAGVLALAAAVAIAAAIWVAVQPEPQRGDGAAIRGPVASADTQAPESVADPVWTESAATDQGQLETDQEIETSAGSKLVVVDGVEVPDAPWDGPAAPGSPWVLVDGLGALNAPADRAAERVIMSGSVPVAPPATKGGLTKEFYAPGAAPAAPAESRKFGLGRPHSAVLSPDQRFNPDFNTEAYDAITDNPFRRVADHPLSTFSIDVDTASYANVRRIISSGSLPRAGAVRIEEMINYFPYYYAAGGEVVGEHPFITNIEVAGCPWNSEHRLVRVGLQAKDMAKAERPPSNLVFLIDVSGSMNEPNKLPLVQQSLRMLVNELGEDDRVAMVVYAGASGLVLDSTPCHRRTDVLAAIERLGAGGSTNGAAGIEQAYRVAAANFINGGTNRVILATDGDFNVGVTDRSSLGKLIEEKRKSGVFLSVLGFGMGNLKDGIMEELSNKGNGNYAYIDSLREARKVLVEQAGGTLVTMAKDVKIQVEFNPATVASYRLIGYENRVLAKEDFNDDRKDAGEIGAGHTVTALYEVVPAGRPVERDVPPVDDLKYQRPAIELGGRPLVLEQSGELLTLKLRYKQPEGDVSTKVEYPVRDAGRAYAQASADFKFAAAVAGLGMILRDSPHKGAMDYNAVLELAQEGVGEDKGGYRAEFMAMVRKAREIAGRGE